MSQSTSFPAESPAGIAAGRIILLFTILFFTAPAASAQSPIVHQGLPAVSRPVPVTPTAINERFPQSRSTRAAGGALVGLVAGSILGGALLHFGVDANDPDEPEHAFPFTERPDSELDPGSIPMSLVGLFVGALIGDRITINRHMAVDLSIGTTPYAALAPHAAYPASGSLRITIPLGR